jgi:trigger factor
LLLGSKNFIPGFEENLIGVKKGEKKEFKLTFPKDYQVAVLQNKEVTFEVTVHKVQELKAPALDDKFASTVGPFKTVAELKADVKKQLTEEKAQQTQRNYENELIKEITDKSQVQIPSVLIDEQILQMEESEKRDLNVRGQTWDEHLKQEEVTQEEHRQRQRPAAEERVKAGLVLSEIANQEKIGVTPEELEVRIQLLKGQYKDELMQKELDKPENRQDIAARLLTEKTIRKLAQYSAK